MQLVVLNQKQLSNGKKDYNSIGIRWNGENYKLEIEDDLIYPIMKFIQRGSYIAFTIPLGEYDKNYFSENDLIDLGGFGMLYVAKEFEKHADFLGDIDVHTDTEPLPNTIKGNVLKQVGKGSKKYDHEGTYVNADFHVKYQAAFIANRIRKVG